MRMTTGAQVHPISRDAKGPASVGQGGLLEAEATAVSGLSHAEATVCGLPQADAIAVSGLKFSYGGSGVEAIRGLDFSVHRGEVFGFLGPSGAGKSTTQKILIGILRGYTGRVEVMGRDLCTHGPDYYERIGVAFETPNFYAKLTAIENLRFFSSLYSGKTADPAKLLAMVGLEDEAGTRVSSFSKGMKVRLNVCRALLNRPELLFFDEPTAGLDPVNAKMVKELILREKTQGKTVFLTTHNMTVATDICDRVAFIVSGRLNLIDSPHALMVSRGKRTVRVEYRESDCTLTRDFDLDGIGDDEQFIGLLRTRSIETIHTQEATLEDVFIEVTGQRLV